MKQYKITSENIVGDSPDDCLLKADDPIHELKIAHYMGGLGSEARLAQYKASMSQQINNNNNGLSGNQKAQIMREQNIKSGTKEWFQLWFGSQRS